MLAVDQDSIAARRVVNTAATQVFTKQEPAGDVIVGLFNTGSKARPISVAAATLGLPSGKRYALANLWTHTTAVSASISATVPSHGVALYRVTAP